MKLQVFFIFVVLAGVSLAKKHPIQGRVDNLERQRLTDFAGKFFFFCVLLLINSVILTL